MSHEGGVNVNTMLGAEDSTSSYLASGIVSTFELSVHWLKFTPNIKTKNLSLPYPKVKL